MHRDRAGGSSRGICKASWRDVQGTRAHPRGWKSIAVKIKIAGFALSAQVKRKVV